MHFLLPSPLLTLFLPPHSPPPPSPLLTLPSSFLYLPLPSPLYLPLPSFLSDCETLHMWLKKLQDDSETANYILTNTKEVWSCCLMTCMDLTSSPSHPLSVPNVTL